MTLSVTLPDALYRRIAGLATRLHVSVERMVATGLGEQLAGWSREEQMAARGNHDRFVAALDEAPDAEPAPEDRLPAAGT